MEQMTPMGLPLGIHYEVPAHAYHTPAMGVVSKSALDQVHRSPLHYLHWLHSETPETPALTFGRAFHAAVLEPEVFAADYAVEPDFGDCRRKAGKEARDAWRADNGGKVPLSADSGQAIRAMQGAIRQHPLASRMLTGGHPEVTVTWQDEGTGLYCRSRADYYVPERRMVVDVKTTQDASADAFRRSVVNFRYHVQDALYRDAFAQAGAPVEHFVMVAVEKAAPYAVAVYTLDAEGVAKGYTAARQDIDALASAVASGDFGGYPAGITTLDLPPWAA